MQQLPGSPILLQYGAPAHIDNTVKEYLSRKLSSNWISRGPIDWPARSPDLTPLDFFLWGYEKDNVRSERIEFLEHRKTSFCQAISSIDTATLSNVWKNINIRINYVVRQGVKHIEQTNF